jgi:GNAT superfamily N-acetyltransferase
MTLRAKRRITNSGLEGPRALQPHEHPSAMQLLNTTLRPNGPPSILAEYPLVLGMDNIGNMRVMVRRKHVVSHAALYFSTVLSGDLAFKVGGIGSVATHKSHRGQGLASMVMQDCIRIMEEAGCHFSVLWSQRHDFYRSLGYETAGLEYLYRIGPANLENLSSRCDVVSYSSQYLPAIRDIHDRENFRTERTEEEWQTYLGLPKSRILLALRGSRVTAYAVMGKGEDFNRCVLEWGGDAQDLLSLIREFAAAAGGDIMILVPAHSNDLVQLLERMQLPKVFEYLALIRIIDAEGLCSVISGFMRDRLGKEFQIRTFESGFSIKIGKEESSVVRVGALPRILFGPDAASTQLRGLSRATASALDKALPIPLFIWGLDSV